MVARVTYGGVRRDLIRASFCDYFGIGDARADLLIALFERAGEPAKLARPELGVAVNTHRPPNTGALHEAIRLLRSCMDSEAIDCDERGYWLSEVGMAECRRALAETMRVLAGVLAVDEEQARGAEEASGGLRMRVA